MYSVDSHTSTCAKFRSVSSLFTKLDYNAVPPHMFVCGEHDLTDLIMFQLRKICRFLIYNNN